MQKFLRFFVMMVLFVVPFVAQGQGAQVSEYDYEVSTAAYTSIANNGGTAWTVGTHMDVQMPFSINFGENQVTSGSNLRVYPDGSVEFTALSGSRIAPLYYSDGYGAPSTSNIYYKADQSAVTVEWRKVTTGTNSLSFQLKIRSNGNIEFHYGPMTINSSISVLVGMMSSATDIFRNSATEWDTIVRSTTGTTTRTLSATYRPAYNATTGVGTVYTFTQPACAKPSTATASVLSWDTIRVQWNVIANGDQYEVKYSTQEGFDADATGTSVMITNATAREVKIGGLLGSTTYYVKVRKYCGTTPSGWRDAGSVTTPASCPDINSSAFTVVNPGLVSWTLPATYSKFDIQYGPADFDPDQNEGTLISNRTGASYTLTGLASATEYYVYFRAHCTVTGSDEATDWVGPKTFTSPCGAIDVPYTQTFSGASIPACWSEDVINGSAHWSFQGNGQAQFPYTENAISRLITPVFNLNPTGEYQVDFYHAEVEWSGYVDSLILYYRTSSTSEWIPLGRYGNHSSTLLPETVLLPNPSATYQLAFEGKGMDALNVYIANVTVRTQPTCRVPSGLAVDDVTGNNVTLSWTENGTATAWQIAYGLFTTDDDYVIVDATTNPFTVSGLGLGEWFFYVRSNCAANDQSEWIGGVSHNFGYCTPAPTSVDNQGITKVTFGNTLVVNDNTATGSNYYQNHADMIGDLFAGAESELSITYRTGYTYGTKIWIDFNDDFDFEDDGELVYTGLSANSNPTTLVATFTIPVNAPLGDHRMRIGGTDNDNGPDPCYSSTYGVLRDYTVRVVAAPSCFKPNSLAVSGVTSTEATLTWVEAGLSTQWEVKLGPRGFNPNETGTSFIVNGTPTLNLTYLYMVTNYDAYVRAICDPEGPTEWSNVCKFSTLCPNGGSVTMGTGTTATSGVIVNSSWGNTYCQQIFTAAELATAGLQAGDIAGMTFTWSGNGTYQKDFSIYLGNTTQENFSSTTAWVPIASQTLVYGPTLRPTEGTTGEQEYTFTTPFTWDGTSNIVVSTFINQHGGSQSGSGFNSNSTNSGMTNMAMWKYRDSQAFTESEVDGLTASGRSGYRASIKFIRPCDTGSCNAPTTAIALSETEYAATLTFTDVNNQATPTYGIVYGPQGFDPETAGTPVSPITTNSYTISNLTMTTTYDVYVYAICGTENGRKVRYTFTTPFIPNCKTPVDLAVSNVTYNTANLTWRQPGDQPLTWTVRYAAADFVPATAAATDYTELTVQGAAGATAQLTGLVAGTTYYVYVKATCATSPLDESPWSSMSNANPAYTFTTPTCVTPTAVTASDVTNTTAMIKWTENGNATNWTLKYGPMGFDLATEGTEVEATADSIELTGLDPYVNYDVYVKSNCTATDESGWSAVASFRTKCPDGSSATIGDGTGTTTGVPVANYGSTYCQQIFTAEELREAGVANNIAGLAFNWQAIDASYDKYFTIWLANTDKSSFASTSDFVPYSELTKVYGPVFIEHGTGAGEQEYVFNNAFQWDGNSNIVVVTLMNAGSTDNNASRRAYTHNTGVSNISMYQRKDGSQYTEGDLATITGSSRSTYRANITFIAPCNTSVTCFAPTALTSAVDTTNHVTLTWAARTDLRPVVNNYELVYGPQGFNPDYQGVMMSNLNDINTTTITGLDYGMTYDFYVRTVCGGDNHSKWAQGPSFTTWPSCWIPDSLTVMETSQTSATLSWRENTPAAASRWEVAYGPKGFNPDNATAVQTTNNHNFVLTGLNHSTEYEFRVRTLCSATDYSDWSAPAYATTQCGIWQLTDMPLTENFDGYTGNTSGTLANHVMPDCWSYLNGGTNTTYKGLPSIYSTASYSHSSPNTLRFYSYNASTDADQYAILPEFGFNLDTLEVSFYGRFYNTASEIRVGVMSDPTDASTFEVVQTVTAPTSGYNTQKLYEVSFSEYAGTGRYVAFMVPKAASNAYRGFYMDDLTVKLREKVNTLPDNGGSIVACNEFIMPDTTGGNYSNNMNATYVVRPAEAGKVLHLAGNYDLEQDYDFLRLYRGAKSANNLVATYTGNGTIDYQTSSNLWADSGYVTLEFVTDGDNAFDNTGFKLLATCVCPDAAAEPEIHNIDANGTYTWENGNGRTWNNQVTMAGAPDLTAEADYSVTNVAGCDSIVRHLNLTLHPAYTLRYTNEICERDTFHFYGQNFTTGGQYTVTLQSQYGADSTGIVNLTVHAAPTAGIYYNGRAVTAVDAFCDGAEMTLNARSNVANATFVWEDNSIAATRVVTPHEINSYSVVATDPAFGCTSLPANLTVTTTLVPELTISGNAEICAGQNATLTVSDANGLNATYRWSTGATTPSITVNPATTTTYTVTATTANASACQTTAEFTVVVNPLPVVAVSSSVNELCLNDQVTLTAAAVDGYTYSWSTGATTAVATTTPAATGVYTVAVTDLKGCVNEFTTDTIVVYPSYELTEPRSACVGMLPYTWGTQTLTEAGNYDQTFTIAHNCDSLVHLTFTVEDTAVNNIPRELCLNTPFTFGEGIYQQSYIATENTTISYVDSTSGECPARYVLTLTVNQPAASSFDKVVCDSMIWNNVKYTATGNYNQTFQTTKGCDSVVTMNLTVNNHSYAERSETTCDRLVWNAETYTEVGDYVQNFSGADVNGCDSTETLHLTAVYHATTGVDNIICCNSRSYTWIDGQSYTLSEIGGNITHTLTNAAGCDSVITLHLVMNPVTDTLNWADTSACDELVIDTVTCDGSIRPAYIRESGDYEMRTHNAALDRDQWTRLHVTINTSAYHTTYVQACLPYDWKMDLVTATGDSINDYLIATVGETMQGTDTAISFIMPEEFGNGCNNIEVLRLHALRPTDEFIYDTICQNQTWTADNKTSYKGSELNLGSNDRIWARSTNVAGCELRKHVLLTVNPVYSTSADITLCESEFAEGKYTYANPNNAKETIELTIPATLGDSVYNSEVVAEFTTATGCDSTVTVRYTVKPTLHETVYDTSCYVYTWKANDVTYDKIGIINDTVINKSLAYGCDSITTLVLTLNDTVRAYDTLNFCTEFIGPDGAKHRESMTIREIVGTTKSGCDSVHYTVYNVLQNDLTVVNVVSNKPYTWVNGRTYNANVDSVYYEKAIENIADGQHCDSVLMLNFTMDAPIAICADEMPYTTSYGFVIDSAIADDTCYRATVNDTNYIIYYTIHKQTPTLLTQVECDSYTWDSVTYDTTGTYTNVYTDRFGCDSTVVLNLTINHKTNNVFDATACGSYTWAANGTTYKATGDYTYSYNNADNCPSKDILHLTIYSNTSHTDSITACQSYTWHDSIYSVAGTYTLDYIDANGCVIYDTLTLTIDQPVEVDDELIVNRAYTTFEGVLYVAPIDTIVDVMHANINPALCDTIHHVHLKVTNGEVINDSVVACGEYTWMDGNTYEWIPATQRVNPMFNYRNRTTDEMVQQNPTFNIYDATTGELTEVHVLWLTISEAVYVFDTINNFSMDSTLTVEDRTLSFTDYKAGEKNVTIDTVVRFASEYYCESIVAYHINLIYTDTIETNDTACNTYQWRGETFTASGTYYDTVLAGNSIDSLYVLNLVVNNSTYNAEAQSACTSYTWHGTDYITTGVYTYEYENADHCASVDTLHLAILAGDTTVIDTTVCDSFVWNAITFTESTDTIYRLNSLVAPCDSLVRIDLTVNYSVEKEVFDTVYGGSYRVASVNRLIEAPFDDTLMLNLTTVNGCDSIVTLNLYLTQYENEWDNQIACGSYTWTKNNHTYQWISDAERAAHNNALYKDLTANTYVTASPVVTIEGIIWYLNLTLNEASFTDTTINVLVSQLPLTLGDSTFNFDVEADTVVMRSVSYGPHMNCDSIVNYTINLHYNYVALTDTICGTETEYTWNGTTYTLDNTRNYFEFVQTLNPGTATEEIDTMKVTRRLTKTGSEDQDVCDSYIWNDVAITTPGIYVDTLVDVNGCDSIATLNLTLKYNSNSNYVITECDEYTWKNGITYTASVDTTYAYTALNGCPSVDTLHLTINVNNGGSADTISYCNTYHWDVTNMDYTVTGNYGKDSTDENGCVAHRTLNLTIYNDVHVECHRYVGEAIRWNGRLYTPGESYNFQDTVGVTIHGCDSIHDSIVHVGNAHFYTDYMTECNSYTWRDGNTYVWISAEERAAHNNALYKNQTTGDYVLYNPTFTVAQQNDYDSIYMLMLSLVQNFVGSDDTTVFVSQETLTYGDSVIDFSAENALASAGNVFNGKTITRDVHFSSVKYCDSIVNLTVHVVNNYINMGDTDICASQTSFAWRGVTNPLINSNYDEAQHYIFYNTLDNGYIEYINVIQHPYVYSVERRTACDSYTWNGHTYTTDISNATAILPDQYGCDSTVILILTIKNNTNQVDTKVACDSYKWTTVDGHNFTYTTSGEYAYEYTATNGCPSVDSLYLTINSSYTITDNQVACDSYMWNGVLYDTTGLYVDTLSSVAKCDSVVTLNLTVNYNTSNSVTDTACDSYTWNRNDSIYTTSGTYYYNYEAANGCASVDTLYLTVNYNTSNSVTDTACDSFTWNRNDSIYTTSGTYYANYTTEQGCASTDTLVLTVNHATYNDTTVLSCKSFAWNGTKYTESGDYAFNYDNADGCASRDSLHLTISEGRTFFSQTVVNCGPYTWTVNDTVVGTFEESINTSYAFNNERTNCDSVVFLNLTIKDAPVTDTADVICPTALPYTWAGRGIVMTAAGDTAVTYPMENGCDSTVRFTLTVNPILETSLTDNVCLGQGYKENGFDIAATELATAGIYTFVDSLTSEATGCDSIVTLTLTVGDVLTHVTEMVVCDSYIWTPGDSISYTLTESGSYASAEYPNVKGCISIDSLYLTINVNPGVIDSIAACDTYTWNGTEYTTSGQYKVRFADANGCYADSILDLTINSSIVTIDTVTACDTYTWTNDSIYTESGVYVYNHTTEAGCSAIDTLLLTVNKSTTKTQNVTACNSYTWNDSTYTTTGVYTYATTNAADCDSTVTLNLTVNYSSDSVYTVTACNSYSWFGTRYGTSGVYAREYTTEEGCSSVDTLHLTINYSANTSYTETACESYTWNDTTYTTSGTYYYGYTTEEGCASIDTLYLTINYGLHNVATQDVCDSYTWNGQTYTTTGVYTYAYNTADNCASVDTLHLTVRNSVASSFDATICYGTMYLWNDRAYATAGQYEQTFVAANGCDSIVTLTLTIDEAITNTINVTSCGAYTWNDLTYANTGVYTQNFTSANGCDSVVTMNLTVNNPTTSTRTEVACDSYTWNGTTYTTSGIYTDTTTGANGCDSVATLMLTINHGINTTYTEAACESYLWNGTTYTTSGTYTYSYTDLMGCAIVDTLNLTINYGTHNAETQVACDSYTWHGTPFTTSDTYTYMYTNADNCVSVDTLHLTINNSSASNDVVTACDSYTWINGITYYNNNNVAEFHTTNAAGCDSTVTLNLTINVSSNAVQVENVCDTYTWMNGETYTESTTVNDTLVNASGCDSVVTLRLTVRHSTEASFEATICDYINLQPYGLDSTITTSGIYTATIVNSVGCDSVVSVNLTVNHSDTAEFTVYWSAENVEGYIWIDGNEYRVQGDYEYVIDNAAGCDSVNILHFLTQISENIDMPRIVAYSGKILMVDMSREGSDLYSGYRWYKDNTLVEGAETGSYNEDGYPLLTGCFYAEVEVNGVWYKTNTICLENGQIGIDDVEALDITFTVAPNPALAGSMMRVTTNLSDAQLQGATLMVYDLQGRVVLKENMDRNEITIRAAENSGVYTIRLITKAGESYAKKVIVK